MKISIFKYNLHVVKHMDIVLLPPMQRNIELVKVRSFHRAVGEGDFFVVRCIQYTAWGELTEECFYSTEAEYSEFLRIFTLRIYCTSSKGVTKKSPSKYVTYTGVLQARTEYGILVGSRTFWRFVCCLSDGSWQCWDASDYPP